MKEDAEKALLLGDTSWYLPMKAIGYQGDYLYLYIVNQSLIVIQSEAKNLGNTN